MEKSKNVSGHFFFITIIFVIGVAGYFYIIEIQYIDDTVATTAKVVGVENVPRRCILQLKSIDPQISEFHQFVGVPFWDAVKVGEHIRVRVDVKNVQPVKIDEFMYLHITSIGILTGCLVLLVIVFGVQKFKKRE